MPIQSVYSEKGDGTYLAMRLLFDVTKAEGTLDERTKCLGLTDAQQKILASLIRSKGLVVLSGKVGQGKTTLLRAIFESMAEEMPEKNYLAFEDPPEYPLKGVKQLNVLKTKINSEEERETRYAEYLARMLRSDLNTGLIGEIRYPSAAHAAITAALTGHSIWTTVHASNALAIVSRFRELGIPLNTLCNPNVLAGMTYQCLLPKLCPECKQPLMSHPEAIPKELFNRLGNMMDTNKVFVRGPGCGVCKSMKMKNQTVAAEVIKTDPVLLGLLREEKLDEAHRYWVEDLGGLTHLAHAIQLVKSGDVDPYIAEMNLSIPLNADLYDKRKHKS